MSSVVKVFNIVISRSCEISLLHYGVLDLLFVVYVYIYYPEAYNFYNCWALGSILVFCLDIPNKTTTFYMCIWFSLC